MAWLLGQRSVGTAGTLSLRRPSNLPGLPAAPACLAAAGCSAWSLLSRRGYAKRRDKRAVNHEVYPDGDLFGGPTPTPTGASVVDDDDAAVGAVVEDEPDTQVAASLRRPRLPQSIKGLNKILSHHRPVQILEREIKETFVRGSGPGGQAINKTSSSVSLIHLPTGIRIQAQPTRSREQNRTAARRILQDRLDALRAEGKLPGYDAPGLNKGEEGGDLDAGRPRTKKEERAELATHFSKDEIRAQKVRLRKARTLKKQKKARRLKEEAKGAAGDKSGSGDI